MPHIISTPVAIPDADLESDEDATPNISGDLEIHVGLQTRPTKEQKTQHELEMALKRRLNRDIKDRQLLLHKVSLMCQIGRSLRYNRLLGESDALMQAALKLLPSKNAYPTERGVELKYLQSFVTWFKTAVKLLNPNLYSEQSVSSKKQVLEALLEQIKRKEARCKQDMIFIFIVLARGMGMHCRLIVNLQPMPLRPSASDLIPIKLKPEEKNKSQTVDSDDEDEEDSEPKKPKSSKAKPQPEKPKEAAKKSSDKPLKKESSKPGPSDKNKSSSSTKKEAANKSGASTSKGPEKNVKKDTGKATSSTNQIKKEEVPQKEDVPKSRAVKKETISKTSLSSKLASKDAIKSERSRTSDSSFEEKPSTSKAASHMSLPETKSKPNLSLLKRVTTQKITEATEGKRSKVAPANPFSPVAGRTRRAQTKPKIEVEDKKGSLFSPVGSPVVPELVLPKAKRQNGNNRDAENTQPAMQEEMTTRSRSKSPKVHISSAFLGAGLPDQVTASVPTKNSKSPDAKVRVSPTFLTKAAPTRHLRSRQQKATNLTIPQLDGAEDVPVPKKRPKLEKLQKSQDSDEVFEPSKPVKKAPVLPKSVQNLRKDRRVLSTDDEGGLKPKRKPDASDMWVEVWSEVEEQWICIDLFKGKLHCVDTIRVSSSIPHPTQYSNPLMPNLEKRNGRSGLCVCLPGRSEPQGRDGPLLFQLEHNSAKGARGEGLAG